MPLRPPAGFISVFYDPLKNPNAPTIGTANGGDASASVTFTAPDNVGGSPISEYYAVSNPGRVTSSGASSPVTVTGLTNDTSYTFQVWALNTYGPGPFSAASNSVTPVAFVPRGLFAGGSIPGGDRTNVIQFISIATTGNATDFGDLTVGRIGLAACSSSTRGVWAGGVSNSAFTNIIDYVTIASAGNASDFGDILSNLNYLAGCSSSTRGLFGGGEGVNVIQYITIASVGNAIDFGDLIATEYYLGACSSSTRGLFAGGLSNVIQYVTIATTGNAIDFGDLTVVLYGTAGCSSSTRGLFGAGLSFSPSVYQNIINYVTIASTGNAINFGDLTVGRWGVAACSSSLRGVWAGGENSGGRINVMDYVTIATTGNATDFGDLIAATSDGPAGCSNAHGGL